MRAFSFIVLVFSFLACGVMFAEESAGPDQPKPPKEEKIKETKPTEEKTQATQDQNLEPKEKDKDEEKPQSHYDKQAQIAVNQIDAKNIFGVNQGIPQIFDMSSSSPMLAALRQSIIGHESGGKFFVVNPHSGALGLGQVLPSHLTHPNPHKNWGYQALGRWVSPQEFLNNPQIQLSVIDNKLNEYFQREMAVTGGNVNMAVRRTAATWYSGNPNLWNSMRPQGGYPSIAAYTWDIANRFNKTLSYKIWR